MCHVAFLKLPSSDRERDRDRDRDRMPELLFRAVGSLSAVAPARMHARNKTQHHTVLCASPSFSFILNIKIFLTVCFDLVGTHFDSATPRNGWGRHGRDFCPCGCAVLPSGRLVLQPQYKVSLPVVIHSQIRSRNTCSA